MNPIKSEWDVYKQLCPSRAVLDRVANKWTMLILAILDGSPLRFNQLKRQVEGISQKMLTQTLKSLERDGLVARKVMPLSPVQVEYSITPLGHTLALAIDPICKWAEAHMEDISAARKGCGLEPR